MKRSSTALRVGVVAMFGLMTAFSASTALAQKDNSDVKEKKKNTNLPEWDYPQVQGIVDRVYWAPGTKKNTWTPSFDFFSVESNLEMSIYVDDAGAQMLMKDGSVCVGKFVVATGNRIDETALSALGLQIPDQPNQCGDTLGPQPK